MRLDETLALLPDVGLRLGYMGQHDCGTWGAHVHAEKGRAFWWGQGDTAIEAVANALQLAGFNLEDDGT